MDSSKAKDHCRTSLTATHERSDARPVLDSFVQHDVDDSATCFLEGVSTSGFEQPSAIIDCKSLYDSVKQSNPSLEEKRTIIDVPSIRETLGSQGAMLWMPTHHMWADALTKVSKDLRARMTQFMDRTRVALRNPEVIHCDFVTRALQRYDNTLEALRL